MKKSILPLSFSYDNKHQHYMAMNMHTVNSLRPMIFNLSTLLSLPSGLFGLNIASTAATIAMQYHAIDFVKMQHTPGLSTEDLLAIKNGGLRQWTHPVNDKDIFTMSRDFLKGVFIPESNYIHGNPVLATNDGTVFLKFDSFFDTYNVVLQYFMRKAFPIITNTVMPIGNFVIIKHDTFLYSIYGHLKQGSVKVKIGDRVIQGQQIAEVGSTGNSYTSHLHFQFAYTPSPIIPLNISLQTNFDKFLFHSVADEDSITRFIKDISMYSAAYEIPIKQHDIQYRPARNKLPTNYGFIKPW